MNISRVFIERPIMTTLVMAALGDFRPVRLFHPAGLRPAECGFSHHPGQRPAAGRRSRSPWRPAVAAPLENQFSTIPGIDQMTSNSTHRSDQHHHAVRAGPQHRRRRPGRAVPRSPPSLGQLPKALPRPPTFRKVNPNDQPIMYISMFSDTMALAGSGRICRDPAGARKSPPSMASPRFRCSARANMACASRPIPTRWRRARSASISLPTLSPTPMSTRPPASLNGARQSASILATGQLNNAADFRRQIIAYRNGAPVRLGDVATVIDGQESCLGGTWLHQKKGVALAITRQPGSNTVEVIDKIKAILPHFEAGLPKARAIEDLVRPERRSSAPRSTTCRSRC